MMRRLLLIAPLLLATPAFAENDDPFWPSGFMTKWADEIRRRDEAGSGGYSGAPQSGVTCDAPDAFG